MCSVSTATVSRVINGNYPVHEKTAKKVLHVIRILNYHPNAMARSLKNNRTFTIDVVVPDISNPYFMQMARGIESIVTKEGYRLIFGSSNEKEDKEIEILKTLNERQVDAVILATRSTNSKYLNRLIQQGLNLVMVDTKIPGVLADVVVEDSWSASYEIVHHLLSNGHKKIGIIHGLMSISTAQQHFDAYKKALLDYSISIHPPYVIKATFNREGSRLAVLEMIRQCKKDLPTALFSTNNYMTEGALIALKESNLSVPNDISIVSFGNISVPQLFNPKLTIIEQSSFLMG